MLYERILVPLKNDPGDEAVLGHATELARLGGSALVLAHVAHTHTRDAAAVLNEEAQRYLEQQAAAARAAGVKVQTIILDGEASEGICQAAAETDADLIVMGTHGHSQVRHFLLGSVTERVIRSSDRPVLLVRP